jgi:hypothetical protein
MHSEFGQLVFILSPVPLSPGNRKSTQKLRHRPPDCKKRAAHRRNGELQEILDLCGCDEKAESAYFKKSSRNL